MLYIMMMSVIKQKIVNVLVVFVYAFRKLLAKNNQSHGVMKLPKLIGHGKYHCNHRNNSLNLFKYLIEDCDFEIIECDVMFTKDGIPVLSHDDKILLYGPQESQLLGISENEYAILSSLSLSSDKEDKLTRLEDLFIYAHDKRICVMLDLMHAEMNWTHTRNLYRLVVNYSFLDKTIWADGNWQYLYLLDPSLMIQIETKWDNSGYKRTKMIRKFFNRTINSFLFKNDDSVLLSSSKMIAASHDLGILMKVSGVNDVSLAHQLLEMGVDFILTDVLTNKDIKNEDCFNGRSI